MLRREVLRASGLLFGGVVASNLLGCSMASAPTPGPVLTLRGGRVQGEIVGDVHRFLGISYAESPFAQNRFRTPIPRRSWAGIFPANSYGDVCPQAGPALPGAAGHGQDCLNLNVWTPDPSSKGLPVMVFAHGGGQSSGAGSQPIYDGSQFARDGVVLVTCNRRLGAEGYLYLEPWMGNGIGPGNLGILDQIEVLKWVQENIRSFGGDPNNVTLFGQSGGAAAVQAVVATPVSKGLLHKVIIQSGGYGAQRQESAKEISRYVLGRLDTKPGALEDLQERDWRQFVNLYEDIDKLNLGHPEAYLPVLGPSMPVHPADAAHAGFGLELDYLIGSCADEATLFQGVAGGIKEGRLFERVEYLLGTAGLSFQSTVEAYRSWLPDLSTDLIELSVIADMRFRAASMRIAQGHALRASGSTFTYLFDLKSPRLGAAHGLDLIVFGNGNPLESAAGEVDIEKTADFMRRSWINFAGSGDPSSQNFIWPKYDMRNRRSVSINDAPSILEYDFAGPRQILGKVMTDNWQLMGL